MRITVFTPTYNRAHTLTRLYESLRRQTFTDFEWLIVDDGSADETAELLDDLEAGHSGFPIRRIKTPNGGKHRAINVGCAAAVGDLFFIVDSDDYLPPDSLQVIDAMEQTIPNSERSRFAGVCGLKAAPDGTLIGTTFEGDVLDITTLERGAHAIAGDKGEVVYTEVLRAYPFPEFPGERFLTEAVVWDRIAHDGRVLRFFNQVIYSCEYLAGGLSDQYHQLLRLNPRGHGLYLRQHLQFARLPFRRKIGAYLSYYDIHRTDLPLSGICKNLGLTPLQLHTYRALRSGKTTVRQLQRAISGKAHTP